MELFHPAYPLLLTRKSTQSHPSNFLRLLFESTRRTAAANYHKVKQASARTKAYFGGTHLSTLHLTWLRVAAVAYYDGSGMFYASSLSTSPWRECHRGGLYLKETSFNG